MDPRGPQGDQGVQGYQGPQGELGTVGSQGERGAAGPQGQKGSIGEPCQFIQPLFISTDLINIGVSKSFSLPNNWVFANLKLTFDAKQCHQGYLEVRPSPFRSNLC